MKKCVSCKYGELKPGTTVFTVDRDGVLVVVRNVPALVCQTCEETYFEEGIAESLLQEVDEAEKIQGQVLIREYKAA